MKSLKDITRLTIVAALYVALTAVSYPLSFEHIQFRISEILVFLCFFRKDYIYSLIVGCILANFLSPFGILDVVLGTLATAISVILIAYSKKMFIASLYPAIFNGIIIGGLIYFTSKPLEIYWVMGFVALGEFVVVSIIGYIVFRYLSKNKLFMEVIQANQNIPTEVNLEK